jgi:hypothetical protein
VQLRVEGSSTDLKELEPEADALIARFDTWFQSLQNEPLVNQERAMIKTFIAWAAKGCPEAGK